MRLIHAFILFALFWSTTTYSLDTTVLQDRLDLLSHQKLKNPPELHFLDYIKGCVISRIHVPVYNPLTKKTETIKAIYTFPDVNKVVPAVLIIPSIYDNKILEQKVSDQLCDVKIASIFPEFNMNIISLENITFESFDNSNRTIMLRLRTLLDVFELVPQVDQKRIGLYGISLGGVLGSQLALVDSRVKANVFAAAGANFAGILTHSQEKSIKAFRQRLMQKYRLKTTDEYFARLKKQIKLETLFFSDHFASKPTFLMIVTNDVYVPTDYQNKLRDTMLRPKVMYINKGHVWSIIKFVQINKTAPFKFLLQNL
ncbi:MAG: hypothetical protein ISR65_06835 [Bacteriovoracaceae bacterium]|nr:hypothetical protein [Bacteriovoracaceae bacterium]